MVSQRRSSPGGGTREELEFVRGGEAVCSRREIVSTVTGDMCTNDHHTQSSTPIGGTICGIVPQSDPQLRGPEPHPMLSTGPATVG